MMEKPGSKPTDELVRRAIIGDGTAFTELWDTHIGGLRSYLKGEMKYLDDFYIDDYLPSNAFYEPHDYSLKLSLVPADYKNPLDDKDSENKFLLTPCNDAK